MIRCGEPIALTAHFRPFATGGPTRNDDDGGIFPKAEQASPFWCQACGFAIPSCQHRVVYGTAPGAITTRPLTHAVGVFTGLRILRRYDQYRQ